MSAIVGDIDFEMLQARIRELEAQVDDLEADLATVNGNNKELREEIKRLESNLEESQAEAERLRDRIDDEFGGYDDLAGKVEALLALLDEVERPVGSLQASPAMADRGSRALIALYDAVHRSL